MLKVYLLDFSFFVSRIRAFFMRHWTFHFSNSKMLMNSYEIIGFPLPCTCTVTHATLPWYLCWIILYTSDFILRLFMSLIFFYNSIRKFFQPYVWKLAIWKFNYSSRENIYFKLTNFELKYQSTKKLNEMIASTEPYLK